MQNHWTETQLLMYAAAISPAANLEQIVTGYINPIDASFDRGVRRLPRQPAHRRGQEARRRTRPADGHVRKIRDEQVLAAAARATRPPPCRPSSIPEMGAILEAQQNVGSKIADIEQANAKTISDDAGDTYNAARTSLVVMLVLGILLSMALATLVARSIVRSVRGAKAVLDEVAAGDLTARMDVTSGDEVGQMGRALNESLDRIAEMVRLVGTSATSLAGSSTRLTGVARTIASGVDDAAEQATARQRRGRRGVAQRADRRRRHRRDEREHPGDRAERHGGGTGGERGHGRRQRDDPRRWRSWASPAPRSATSSR